MAVSKGDVSLASFTRKVRARTAHILIGDSRQRQIESGADKDVSDDAGPWT